VSTYSSKEYNKAKEGPAIANKIIQGTALQTVSNNSE
jgi:hypothetical protein